MKHAALRWAISTATAIWTPPLRMQVTNSASCTRTPAAVSPPPRLISGHWGVVSRSIDSGDIDNDGDIDIVVGNRQNQNVYHLNDGDGNFGDAVGFGSSGRYWPIKLVDIDNDGDLDVVAAQEQGRINRVFLNSAANDGNLAFTEDDIGSDEFSTTALAIADFDRDGNMDLVTGDHDDGNAANPFENHVYYGNGNGDFQAGQTIQPGQAHFTFSLAAADLNGDGWPDLVEGSQRNNSDLNGETRVYLNNGAGGFLAPTNVAGSNNLHTTVALLLVDFDRDGDIDIMEGNNGTWDDDGDGGTPDVSQPNRLFLNDGSASFTVQDEAVFSTDEEQTYGLAAGDIDGDGIVDAVAGNQTGENALYSFGGDATGAVTTQLTGLAQSTNVHDGTGSNIRFARIIVDSADINVPDQAEIRFSLSNDGDRWVPTLPNRAMEFPAPRNSATVFWRAEISTLSPIAGQQPTLTESYHRRR